MLVLLLDDEWGVKAAQQQHRRRQGGVDEAHVRVHPEQVLGEQGGQVRNEHRAPVAALSVELLEAEARHQVLEDDRHLRRTEAGLDRRAREAVSREGGCDHLKKIQVLVKNVRVTRWRRY